MFQLPNPIEYNSKTCFFGLEKQDTTAIPHTLTSEMTRFSNKSILIKGVPQYNNLHAGGRQRGYQAQ